MAEITHERQLTSTKPQDLFAVLFAQVFVATPRCLERFSPLMSAQRLQTRMALSVNEDVES